MAPNAIDLVKLADVKAWLDIDLADTKDDTLLQTLITGVSQAMLTPIGISTFVTQAYSEVYDGSGTPMQALRQVPITAVASLTINTYSIVASPDGVKSGFAFDKFALKLVGAPAPYPANFGVPGVFIRGFQNVAVTYTAGYAAIPFDIQEAAKEWCAVRYRARRFIGITSKHLATGETVSFSQKAMPDFVKGVLRLYQRNIPV